MDLRVPGIDSRNKVSWMARQSSSLTRTALRWRPLIWMGCLIQMRWRPSQGYPDEPAAVTNHGGEPQVAVRADIQIRWKCLGTVPHGCQEANLALAAEARDFLAHQAVRYLADALFKDQALDFIAHLLKVESGLDQTSGETIEVDRAGRGGGHN